MARSGTTWVYDVLTAHPEAAGINESFMFSREYGLGALLTRRDGPDERRIGLGQLITRDDLFADLRDLASRWLSRAIPPDARYLIEKTPLHVTVVREIAAVFPDARFVHVLRDGRDVAVSVRAAARSWAPGWSASVLESAWRWRRAIRNASQAQPVLGDRLLEVRYEDLKSEPTAQIARLFRFCGMPYDTALVGRVATHTDFRRQFEPDPAAFRRFGRVGDWRTALTPLDLLLFAIGAGGTIVDAGYEASRIWWLKHIAAAHLCRRVSRKTLPRAN